MGAGRVATNVAKLRQAHQALRTLGYAPRRESNFERWRPAKIADGELFVEIWWQASPMFHAVDCRKRGITMPTGPMFFATPRLFDPGLFPLAGS